MRLAKRTAGTSSPEIGEKDCFSCEENGLEGGPVPIGFGLVRPSLVCHPLEIVPSRPWEERIRCTTTLSLFLLLAGFECTACARRPMATNEQRVVPLKGHLEDAVHTDAGWLVSLQSS